ncbi:hypothetical protein FB45DRAFT_1008227 [Roridomyces roridus]|uniref:Zn(2)-C6 fungal-type domain-containing protein n=1 Tax=Roridomyces roridus TaxID=1738132 RepID=A0AAD7BBH1_9AGAR|nr:hypothetical protein FB45DRAFT_1008227 [Roridomyces roridus]
MSTQSKSKKPPACDSCKARRVLCHPQLNGAPCPRCVEKGIICATTNPAPRGRPRKNPLPTTSSYAVSLSSTPSDSAPSPSAANSCPELTPRFIEHCFDCFASLPQNQHPLLTIVPIKSSLRDVSFHIEQLQPQMRVLALCMIALAALVSFDEAVLGPGSLPRSVQDHVFLSSSELLLCGVRRPSQENALSCYFLDLLDHCGGGQPGSACSPSRPWGGAYFSHVRVLAPAWRAAGSSPADAAWWAGFLMADASMALARGTPILFTHHDQLLLCGPAPPSLDAAVACLANTPGLTMVWPGMLSYTWHISSVGRELSENIIGDYARLHPLSETAILKLLASLSPFRTFVSLILDRVDAVVSEGPSDPGSHFVPLNAEVHNLARSCGYAVASGFSSITLALYNELNRRMREGIPACALDAAWTRTQTRLRLLHEQARDIALESIRFLAHAIPYFPKGRCTPVQWPMIYACAQLCAEEVGGDMETDAGLLATARTITRDLKLLGYSLDLFSTPQAAALLERLDTVIGERALREYEQMLTLVDGSASASASYQYLFLPMGEGMV